MLLATRLTMIVAGVLAVGAVVGHALHREHFERHFGAVERIEAQETAHLAQRAIDQLLDEVGRDATRFAWSDRFHAAIGRPNATLDGELLDPEVLSASGIDVAAILEIDGKVRFLSVRHPDDPGVTGLRLLPNESINLSQILGRALDGTGIATERGVLAQGLVYTEAGLLLLAARNLVPSSREETRRGIVLAGRFMGQSVDKELERRLGYSLDVWPVGLASLPDDVRVHEETATASPEPVVIAVNTDRLDVYSTLEDIRRRPELLVRTVLQRDISIAANLAIESALLTSLSLSLFLLLALVVSLRYTTIRPLARLTRMMEQVGKREDYSIRVDEGRKDEVGALAREFDVMLERLEEARRQVIETARAAGMSEIAMGILHNVGNVLNSVNISTSLLTERVESMCIDEIVQLSDILRQHAGNLAKFVSEDPQGQHLQPFVSALAEQLSNDRTALASEIQSLASGIEHVCELVKSQQGLARNTLVVERVAVERLVDDAVRMTASARPGKAFGIQVELEDDLPTLVVDRNKALEILVNLLQNARQAVEEAGPRPDGHRVTVRAHRSFGGRLRIEVRDTGIGIPPENLTRIFQLGFTTKSKGSGLGLHTAANGAKSLGGALVAESNGPGHGASFYFDLPFGSQSEKEAA